MSLSITISCLLALALIMVGCDSPAPTYILPTPAPTSITTPTPTPDPIVLSGFSAPIVALAWSPDGQTLATGIGLQQEQNAPDSSDFSVRLWDRNGELKATLPGHTSAVNTLAWSPDGQTLASGSYDGAVRLWQPDGSPIKTIECGKKEVSSATWSPDGMLLAAICSDSFIEGSMRMWKPDGTLVHSLPTQAGGRISNNLAWSPDSKYLLSGFSGYTLWRADGTVAGVCSHCPTAWGMAWSPDSTKWAAGSDNGQLEIFDLQARSLGYMQANAGIYAIAWSPDGSVIAGGVSLWRPDGKHIADMVGLGSRINALTWSPDSKTLAAASDNKMVGLFAPDGTAKRKLEGHEGTVTRLAWSPAGKMLASASSDKTVRLWHIREDK